MKKDRLCRRSLMAIGHESISKLIHVTPKSTYFKTKCKIKMNLPLIFLIFNIIRVTSYFYEFVNF